MLAHNQVESLRREIKKTFSTVDLLITPTMPSSPVPIAQSSTLDAVDFRNTAPFDVYGLPAITVPTLIMRGQWDGIASFDDLIEFFKQLPNPDKQFIVMPGISHASFQQKNYALVYHILLGFFSQPEPAYRG